MEQQVSSEVTERVHTIDQVGQAVRVFLAGTIAMGIGASALGFFLLPDLMDRGLTSTTTKRATPLRVADVTRAVSLNDANLLDGFGTIDYYAAKTKVFHQLDKFPEAEPARLLSSNQPLTIRRSDATTFDWRPMLGIETAQAQATFFSIEPVVYPGFTSQLLYVWYRKVGDQTDRNISLCVGRTDSRTLYVGSDGSTYTDSGYTKRTTRRPCAEILDLGMKPKAIDQGWMAQQPTTLQGNYGFIRSAAILGRFISSDVIENPGQVGIETGQPLAVGFSFEGLDLPEKLPAAMFTIGDATSVPGQTAYHTICFPEVAYNPETGGPGLYFDRDGNAYYDMWLENRVNTFNCQDIAARILRLTDIEFGHFYSEIPVRPNNAYLLGRLTNQNMASLTPAGAYQDFGVITPAETNDPLYINGEAHTNTDTPVSLPNTIVELHGYDWHQNFVKPRLCVPAMTIQGLQPAPRFYFDVDGNPYHDLFLTKRATTFNCSDVATKAFDTMFINGASADRGIGAAGYGLRLYNQKNHIGTIVYPNWNRELVDATNLLDTPLGLVLWGEDLPPITVPEMKIQVRYQTGVNEPEQTLNICFPGQANAQPGTTVRYYDTQGQAYSDIFLTKALSCSSTSGGGGGGGSRDPIDGGGGG